MPVASATGAAPPTTLNWTSGCRKWKFNFICILLFCILFTPLIYYLLHIYNALVCLNKTFRIVNWIYINHVCEWCKKASQMTHFCYTRFICCYLRRFLKISQAFKRIIMKITGSIGPLTSCASIDSTLLNSSTPHWLTSPAHSRPEVARCRSYCSAGADPLVYVLLWHCCHGDSICRQTAL